MSPKISRRKFFKLFAGTVINISVLSVGGTVYGTRLEPHFIDVARLDVKLPNLPHAFDGFTLAQISDLHLGEWMTFERMKVIAQQVNDLNPDVIAVTGDFLSRELSNTYEEVTESVRALRAKEAVLGVLGNHDYWVNGARTTEAIQQAGNMRLLTNEHVILERSGERLYIAGVDDIWENHHDLNAALEGIPGGVPLILLAHEGDYADEVAKTGRVGMQLSGHSHGGQVRVPIKGAIALPYLGQKYDMGRFNIDQMTLYVNRGVGMVWPYMRIGCPPEITLITLRA